MYVFCVLSLPLSDIMVAVRVTSAPPHRSCWSTKKHTTGTGVGTDVQVSAPHLFFLIQIEKKQGIQFVVSSPLVYA